MIFWAVKLLGLDGVRGTGVGLLCWRVVRRLELQRYDCTIWRKVTRLTDDPLE